MANWAVLVGINQYVFFQSLGYGQADAEALQDFLVKEAGFLPEHCLLLTDNLPPEEQPTYPSRDNLLHAIEGVVSNLQPGDQLWYFFSGYGVTYNGQDYLMPVEGNPASVVDTGIPVRSLFKSLQASAKTILVLLDINRAGGTQAGALIGQETVELAQELQIPTILSCPPNQFSRESAALGHGFFTAALVEALRSGQCNTLAELDFYLSERLPELCRHHWRPIQEPVTVVEPPEKSYEFVLPQLGTVAPSRNERELEQPVTPRPQSISAQLPTAGLAATPGIQTSPKRPGEPEEEPAPTIARSDRPIAESATQTLLAPLNYEEIKTTTPFWQPLLWWAGGIALLASLMLGVFIRNKPGLLGQQAIAPPSASFSGTTVLPPTVPTPPARTQLPAEASRDLLPKQSSIQSQNNQQLLNQARMSIKENQASEFSNAIAIARKIQPGQPLYAQAQQDVDRWSRVIFDLAQGRAQQGQFGAAIAAAGLVPTDQPIYSEVQQVIPKWRVAAKLQLSNRTLLQAATALIRPEQASSYNRAIEVASKVPPRQPGSAQAQQSIDQWSQTILALATSRATKGNLDAAIQTAALVPENTPAYPKAQQAIQDWQSQKSKP